MLHPILHPVSSTLGFIPSPRAKIYRHKIYSHPFLAENSFGKSAHENALGRRNTAGGKKLRRLFNGLFGEITIKKKNQLRKRTEEIHLYVNKKKKEVILNFRIWFSVYASRQSTSNRYCILSDYDTQRYCCYR